MHNLQKCVPAELCLYAGTIHTIEFSFKSKARVAMQTSRFSILKLAAVTIAALLLLATSGTHARAGRHLAQAVEALPIPETTSAANGQPDTGQPDVVIDLRDKPSDSATAGAQKFAALAPIPAEFTAENKNFKLMASASDDFGDPYATTTFPGWDVCVRSMSVHLCSILAACFCCNVPLAAPVLCNV